ncbi:glutamate-5-semialdehyde dehydrogenase [Corticicoccus populi]|uniref:Gamma-glutamyl phosphate reductase n=1 Tax=Corticicoccus populi TaxID=1812821 RepID=A0ABW5WXY2_9STAP
MSESKTVSEVSIEELGTKSKQAAKTLRTASSSVKNDALLKMKESLQKNRDKILEANQKDVDNGISEGMSESLVDRLKLTEERLQGMENGLSQMISLVDPITRRDGSWINDIGLEISKVRVPLGVIGIIYEARPNVTVDASGLCLKAGNTVILRGGKEALNSNRAIVEVLQEGLAASELPKECIQLVTDPSRELAAEFMKANDYIDCLIPRGGAGLIQAVLKQATVPVIETGTGNCHLFVHESADFEMAKSILINSKTHRVSVCNSLETLLADKNLGDEKITELVQSLIDSGVTVHGDSYIQSLVPEVEEADEDDFHKEYLSMDIAVKVIDGCDEAVEHIEKYSTGHSETIAATDYETIQNFLNAVDSAAVYVNSSTRFTDGEMFGFGGEIGISTQKLHARGPMGLEALTSYKYVIQGSGHIRE